MKVAIVMGSDSDWPVMQAAADILTEFDIDYMAKVVSAHRTPHDMIDFSNSAIEQGFDVIIAGAGGAAHLPGMIASCTTLPVIGVPVPVATVAINNATNAALLAIRMLSIGDRSCQDKLTAYAKKIADDSRNKTLTES